MAMLQAKCKNNLHLFSMHNIISHAHHMLLKKEHSYLPKKKTDKINGVAFIMPGSQSTQNLNPKCPALRGWSRKCRALPILNAPNTSEIGLFLPEKIQTVGGGGWGYTFLNAPAIFHFFTLLTPGNSKQNKAQPLDIPSTSSTLFLINPWEFHMLFLWYPWKFHIINSTPLFGFFFWNSPLRILSTHREKAL